MPYLRYLDSTNLPFDSVSFKDTILILHDTCVIHYTVSQSYNIFNISPLFFRITAKSCFETLSSKCLTSSILNPFETS